MRAPDMPFGDYADEDSVTVALPRSPAPGRRQGAYAQAGVYAQEGAYAKKDACAQGEEDSATMALPRPQAGSAVRKTAFKPVVGWLVCIRGNDFGSSFTINLGKNYIGRSQDMDIILHGDEGIAWEKHAAIYYVPKQRRFAVEPGASGKRFHVNRDAVVRPVWIKQHDILVLGNTGLMFFPCCGEHFSWEELIRRQKARNQNR